MRISIIIILLFCLASCGTTRSTPKNLIEFDKFKIVVWQLMKADDYYVRKAVLDSTWRLNKTNIDLYKKVFDLNKVTVKDFYGTLEYYEKRPLLFQELMDSVESVSKKEKIISKVPVVK
jgi:hypothetical protein